MSIRIGERRNIDEYPQLPRRDTENNVLIEDPLDLSRNLNCVLDYEGRIRLRRAFTLFAAKVADATMEELLVQAKTLTRMRTGPTAAAMAAKHAQSATGVGAGGPPVAPPHRGLTAPTLQQHTAAMSQQQGRSGGMEYMRSSQEASADYQGRGSMMQGRIGGGGGVGYNMVELGHNDFRAAPSNLVLSPVTNGPGATTGIDGIRGVRVQQQQASSGGRGYGATSGMNNTTTAPPYYQYGGHHQQQQQAQKDAVQRYIMPSLGYYLELQADGHSWEIIDRW